MAEEKDLEQIALERLMKSQGNDGGNQSTEDLGNAELALQKVKEAQGVEEQVVEEQQEIVAEETQEEQEEATEGTTEEEATEEASETEEEDVAVMENEEVDDLLSFEEETTQAVEDEFITAYQEKIKELGFDGVKSKDEFIAKVAELKAQAESASTVFADDVLKQANDIAKQGGNYLEYLGVATQDYDAVDDTTLLTWSLKEDFANEQELQDYLDEMSDVVKKREVNRLRKDLKAQQEVQKQAIIENAKRAQQQYDASLRSAVESITVVDKVKINDSAKSKVLKDLTTYNEKARATEFQLKYFLNPDGTVNFEKQAQSAYKLELFDKVVAKAASSGKAEGKKEVIATASNVVNPKEGNAKPSQTPRKALSMAETEVERLKKGEKPLF